MTRLIGGLLVVSLLYGPAKFQVKYIAYNLLKDINRIEYTIKKEAEKDTDDFTAQNFRDGAVDDSVDYAYMELDDGTDKIASLIKEKNMLFSKIESQLDLLSHLKLGLSDEQINGFTEFMDCYNKESAGINENLRKIDERKDFGSIRQANLHNDADIDLFLAEIESVNNYRSEAIAGILRIIEAGNRTLQML